MGGIFFLDVRCCRKCFIYGIFFNLEKVRFIFVEEFFIKELYYQSCDKAVRIEIKYREREKTESIQGFICMFLVRGNEDLSYFSMYVSGNRKLGWFELEFILNFM